MNTTTTAPATNVFGPPAQTGTFSANRPDALPRNILTEEEILREVHGEIYTCPETNQLRLRVDTPIHPLPSKSGKRLNLVTINSYNSKTKRSYPAELTQKAPNNQPILLELNAQCAGTLIGGTGEQFSQDSSENRDAPSDEVARNRNRTTGDGTDPNTSDHGQD